MSKIYNSSLSNIKHIHIKKKCKKKKWKRIKREIALITLASK